MKQSRTLQKEEIEIIEYLAGIAQYPLSLNWYNDYTATPMDDGGMGSILLTPAKPLLNPRKFKERISDCIIEDTDGMSIIVSLNIDQDDYLFELDVWKCDFSPVIGKLDINKKKTGDVWGQFG